MEDLFDNPRYCAECYADVDGGRYLAGYLLCHLCYRRAIRPSKDDR